MLALTAGAGGTDLVLYLISGLGLLGGLGAGIKALVDRRAVKAKAGSDDASASAIVAAAARELIDPLRQELAKEREEHAQEIEEERQKVAHVRRELNAALTDVESLRAALRRALQEINIARDRITELETENTRLTKEATT